MHYFGQTVLSIKGSKYWNSLPILHHLPKDYRWKLAVRLQSGTFTALSFVTQCNLHNPSFQQTWHHARSFPAARTYNYVQPIYTLISQAENVALDIAHSISTVMSLWGGCSSGLSLNQEEPSQSITFQDFTHIIIALAVIELHQ